MFGAVRTKQGIPAVYTGGITSTGYFGKFGTISTWYRYRYTGGAGTGFHTGSGNFGKFGTTSIPAQETVV